MKTVWALDFDGVLCDSVIETVRCGWRAAVSFWPDVFSHSSDVEPWLMAAMRIVRPVLESGFETILYARLLTEEHTRDPNGVLVLANDLLQTWNRQKRAEVIKRFGVSEETMALVFGQTRDAWKQENEQAWLEMNPFFKGVVQAVNTALANHQPIYILTTKQERFAVALLSHAGIRLPKEHVFGPERKLAKAEILRNLICEHPGHKVVFVEDRLDMLVEVQPIPDLEHVELRLATWGYNTGEQRQRALETGRILCTDLNEFSALLQRN